jgi:hypothetical protein
MKKLHNLLILPLFSVSASFSQTTYRSAIGLRGGTGYADQISASYKTFLSGGPAAIEPKMGVKPDNTWSL